MRNGILAAIFLLSSLSLPSRAEGERGGAAWGADKWPRLEAVFTKILKTSGHSAPTRLHLAKEHPTIEGSPAAAFMAKVAQNPTDFDMVMVGSSVFDLARDEDEAGFLFAHEVQHLILKHPKKYNDYKMALLDKWAAEELARGNDIYASDKTADAAVKAFFAAKTAEIDAFQVRLEDEADRDAVPLMCKAGIDPRAALRLLGRGERWVMAVGGELGAEHAEPAERIASIRRTIASLNVKDCSLKKP